MEHANSTYVTHFIMIIVNIMSCHRINTETTCTIGFPCVKLISGYPPSKQHCHTKYIAYIAIVAYIL